MSPDVSGTHAPRAKKSSRVDSTSFGALLFVTIDVSMTSPTLFETTWLGYDVPYADVESQPVVKVVRSEKVKKRTQAEEHHLTVGYFPSVTLEALTTFVKEQESAFGSSLEQCDFFFDRYGSLKAGRGHYVYFTPSEDSAKEARYLKSRVGTVEGLSPTSAATQLHLSVGGKDPFDHNKAPMAPLPQTFRLTGRLIFVGKVGEEFVRYVWNSQKQQFLPEGHREPVEALPIHTITIFPKIQIDTLAAIYLLREFGQEAFPGIQDAQIAFLTKVPEDQDPEALEKSGNLMVDLGGMFDHHRANMASGKREECASSLIAKYLGVEKKKYLQKLLTWAKRDDLEGKGTISEDSLDRAFGLSGIVSMLNRQLKNDPQEVIDLILPLIEHHVAEQRHRAEGLPKLYDALEAEGQAKKWKLKQGRADLKAGYVVSDDIGLAGWLKAVKRVDLVIQRALTGHTNVITRQERSIDLRPLIAGLRAAEAQARGVDLPQDKNLLESVGTIDALPMWYYDDAANTLQNGGIEPGDISPTQLSIEQIVDIVNETIPNGVIGALKRRKQKELS